MKQLFTFQPLIIKLLKITAVVLLLLLIAFDSSWRISSRTTFLVTNLCILLFILTTTYEFFTKSTPGIRAMRQLQQAEPSMIFRIPITHYSVLLGIMGNDLLFVLFAANLIYLSWRIPMIRWAGIVLGTLLLLIHLYSLWVVWLHRRLVGIFITPEAIMYYEKELEHIPWDSITRIEVQQPEVRIFMKDEEEHELDFEYEEKDFDPFYEQLLQQADQRNIPLKLLPPEPEEKK
ncbi:MAG: hypothetical protein D6730_12305 [Bacteroidetes bacterium]|nr:MAG: hypothetical protein D6730_12305 [Bacteroidota bacterium]